MERKQLQNLLFNNKGTFAWSALMTSSQASPDNAPTAQLGKSVRRLHS